jgi:hypothetical protein
VAHRWKTGTPLDERFDARGKGSTRAEVLSSDGGDGGGAVVIHSRLDVMPAHDLLFIGGVQVDSAHAKVPQGHGDVMHVRFIAVGDDEASGSGIFGPARNMNDAGTVEAED